MWTHLLLTAMLAIPHGQIAFVLNDGTQSDIYLIWADGRGLKSITSTISADEAAPRWSPSGRIIAYSTSSEGNSGINLFLLDSNRTIKVSSGNSADMFPSFFPNGTMLTFERWSGGEQTYSNLITSTLYGTNQQVLLPEVFRHSWSPVNGQLMFISPKGLVTTNRRGEKETVLLQQNVNVLQAEWSPNDLLIAFIGVTNGQSNIYTISSNGKNIKNITRSNNIEEEITWAPTGDRIAYVTRPDPKTITNEQEMKKRAIRIIDLKTRKRTTLTDGTSECYSPTWAPDGTGLAFVCCYVTTSCQLYVADVAANTMRAITTAGGRISDPKWSPELVFKNN